MDIYKNLILVKGVDRTSEIYKCNKGKQKYRIIYNGSNNPYFYEHSSINFYDAQKEIDISNQYVYVDGKFYYDVIALVSFGKYSRLIFRGHNKICKTSSIELILKNESRPEVFDRISYLRMLANQFGLIVNDVNILAKQYEKLLLNGTNTAIGCYLCDNPHIRKYNQTKTLIYPFGINLSQQQAVENSFSSQVSIIEGPPGTGKTQTILNIISNILVQGKTVAVVSNNNSAIENIYEKLNKEGLDCLVAFLGSQENKERFMQSQDSKNKKLELSSDFNISNLEAMAASLTDELNEYHNDCLQLSSSKSELSELLREKEYFNRYLNTNTCSPNPLGSKHNSLDILSYLNEIEGKEYVKWNILSNLKVLCKYGYRAYKLYKSPEDIDFDNLKRQFYEMRIDELSAQISTLEKKLTTFKYQERVDELKDISMAYCKAYLSSRRSASKWTTFEIRDIKKRSKEFIKQYPVILSTTTSIKNCLAEDFVYDYLIIDEASQVDIATGALALSCARNVVVVGDRNQLPNIVTREDMNKLNKLTEGLVPEKYNYSNSLLDSVCKVCQNAPVTLLREHYRCNPKIIGFCNEKFYYNQLVVMTKDSADSDPLALYYSDKGNHERDHANQRQVDIIYSEVLPYLDNLGFKDIGIITPYRNQVKLLKSEIGSKYGEMNIEIDTVHKFQGREKDAIVLSTVDNQISKFVDDEHMLNVAVSRAKDKLVVVTSEDTLNKHSNYNDLVRYILYNNFAVVKTSTYSVFDLLYKAYSQQRRKYLKSVGRISEYDSENIAYALIQQVLENKDFAMLDIACHVPLRSLIRDKELLNEEQLRYGENQLTHVDFLIYNKLDRSPVLGIEIDGVSFHKEGTKQAQRDKLKNEIFSALQLDLLRLRTDGSDEEKKIIKALKHALN